MKLGEQCCGECEAEINMLLQNNKRVSDLWMESNQQLAAMTKERDEHIKLTNMALDERDEYLKQLDAMTQERNLWQDEYGDSKVELAAAQAREAKLREALWKAHGLLAELNIPMISDALDMIQDTTALDELLKAERERCAKVCCIQMDGEECAQSIRSLK